MYPYINAVFTLNFLLEMLKNKKWRYQLQRNFEQTFQCLFFLTFECRRKRQVNKAINKVR